MDPRHLIDTSKTIKEMPVRTLKILKVIALQYVTQIKAELRPS